MKLCILPHPFSVCRLAEETDVGEKIPFCFTARTDEELSLVCPTPYAPASALEREDGWRAFRVEGTLDFSLVGILARIAVLLAEKGIPIFVVSTFRTDYVLLKADRLEEALAILGQNGYETVLLQ